MPLSGSVITVNALGTTTAKLTVTSPTGGVAPYTVQWQKSTNGTDFTNITDATALVLSETGLTANTTYSYKAVFTDSTPVTPLTLTTDATAILTHTAGGSIATNSKTATTVKLTATAPESGTAPYTVQWKRSADNVTFANITGATALVLNDSGLTPGTAYYYKAVFTDATPTTHVIFDTAVTTVHTDMSDGSIVVNSIAQTAAALTATAPTTGTAPYTQQWQRSTDGTTYADISGKTTLALVDTGLTAGTYYYYQIIFTDNNGSTETIKACGGEPILTHHSERGSEGVVRKTHLQNTGVIRRR